MKKRALITGITGLDGSYLAELLLCLGYEVHGIIFGVRARSTLAASITYTATATSHAHDDHLFLHYGDLSNADYNGIYLVPVNLYSLGNHFDFKTSHVIPALIRKCLEAKEYGENKIVVWGQGKASRQFLYVEDAAKAILLAAERYDGIEYINGDTGSEITIKDLVDLIRGLAGFTGEIEWDVSDTRAERELGFQAPTGFREELSSTIRYYEEAMVQARVAL